MKSIINIFITIFLFGTANFVSAQCGPTEVEPSAVSMGYCEGTNDTISFTATGTCAGNWEYLVADSTATVVQNWSVIDEFIINAPISNVYTVYARCSTCPGTVVSDTFEIVAIAEPTIVADSFICHGTPVSYTASGAAAGTMSWWDSPSNGTQLSPTENYTSPPLTKDDTVYMNITGTITSGTSQGSILITEAGLYGFPGATDADYVEISNLYGTAVNTTGWVVAVSANYNNINNVNNVLWYLPPSFTSCTILSKTDVSSAPNYWGTNILWNPNLPGWAAIIDDVGNLVDFVAWGWTAAQLAGFNTTINGFNITLGTEWSGNGCSNACQGTPGNPFSISRNGNSDNNDALDFICQATSLNTVNPGLNCGWIAADFVCSYPAVVLIDSLPTASAPDTTFVTCYADIPAPDPSIIDDEMDDFTAVPTVTYIGEASNGNLCPEILTRTYHVSDSCNFIEVYHIIVINDTTAPIMDPAPADLNVYCYSDVPPIVALDWTDNCLGAGTAQGVEVSSGTTCPEVLTRTWTISDTCGNTTTQTQVITIFDTISPVIESAPADLTIQCPSQLPAMVSLNWTDNCLGSGVLTGVEVSDGQTCPETITRTWTKSDDCGNTATEVQVIVINDDIPPTASNLPPLQVAVLPPADITLVTDAADNCGTPIVEWFNDVSDNGFCPENVVRTYSVTDDCGNVTYITRNFIIGDYTPIVSFNADPTLLDNLSSGIVEFDNNTTGAATYVWKFGDDSTSTNINPSHKFDLSVTRTFDVWLIATSQYGCIDSTNMPINVFQEVIYFVPNAFTPNNDGYNNVFKPILASGFDPDDYRLLIFNRWGEIMFESNNHEIGWDGTYNGAVVPEGAYVYKIEFGLELDDRRKVISGHFSLLK